MVWAGKWWKQLYSRTVLVQIMSCTPAFNLSKNLQFARHSPQLQQEGYVSSNRLGRAMTFAALPRRRLIKEHPFSVNHTAYFVAILASNALMRSCK